MPADPPWLIRLPTCPSTSSWALERIADLAHGACVWTETQTAGRGRGGSTWSAPRGVLTASFVFDVPGPHAGRMALAGGLAVVHAVEDLLPAARVLVKWPNDCQLHGRKLAGILCERPLIAPPGASAAVDGTRVRAAARDALVIGIGLNATIAPLPTAASLHEIATPTPAMIDLLRALRRYLLEAAGLVSAGSFAALLPELRARDWLRGKRIAVDTGGRTLRGTADGIDDQGRLLLRTDAGVVSVISGSVAMDPDRDHPPG